MPAKRLQILIYPESASAVLMGNTRAWKSRVPPQAEQAMGVRGSISILGMSISKPKASSMRAAILFKETELAGCRNP